MKRIINGREVNLFEKTMFFIGCFTGGITCGAMIGLLLFSIILFLGTHNFVEKGKYMLKTDCVQATLVPTVNPDEDIMINDSLSDREESDGVYFSKKNHSYCIYQDIIDNVRESFWIKKYIRGSRKMGK